MPWRAGAHICRCLRRPGIDSEELIRKFQHRAGIFKLSMGTRNWVGIGLLYRPARARICKPFKEPGIDSQPGGPVWQPYLVYRLARLHRLAEWITQNRFLGSLNVYKYRLRLHWLAELVPGNQFLGSITWRMKMNFEAGRFFHFDLAYFWNKPSSLRFNLFKFLNKQTWLRFDLSNLWNKQSSLHFDLSNLWNKQTLLRFDLYNLWNKQSSLRSDLSNLWIKQN
jgi:hypothetical protein